MICYEYDGQHKTDNLHSLHYRKLTCGTCENLYPVGDDCTALQCEKLYSLYRVYNHTAVHCVQCVHCTVGMVETVVFSQTGNRFS